MAIAIITGPGQPRGVHTGTPLLGATNRLQRADGFEGAASTTYQQRGEWMRMPRISCESEVEPTARMLVLEMASDRAGAR